MKKEPTPPKIKVPCQILVAGDVCLDVLGLPIPPQAGTAGANLENWQQTGEIRTFYRRGGVLLLADFLKAALQSRGCLSSVIQPAAEELSEFHLETLTREDIVHSLLRLCEVEEEVSDAADKKWKHRFIRVAESQGYSGPSLSLDAKGRPLPRLRTSLDLPRRPAALVVFDDTGNRFRRDEAQWRGVLSKGSDASTVFVYKLHRPFSTTDRLNPLWNAVMSDHSANTLVIVDADDLRASGAVISRRLSWERTGLDLLWQIRFCENSSPLCQLRDCPHLVVRLGLDAAMYWHNPGKDQPPAAWLIYDPACIEDQWATGKKGRMVGYGSAFTAHLAATLAAFGLGDGRHWQQDRPVLFDAIRAGLAAARRLLEVGYTRPEGKDAPPDPRYPMDAICKEWPKVCFEEVALPILRDPTEADPNGWTIQEARLCRNGLADQAAKAVVQLKKPQQAPNVGSRIAGLPKGIFGKLETYDRFEIEAYRSLNNLVREYLGQTSPKRPLCLAVFGPPGSGKSFGVEQIAFSVARTAGVGMFRLVFNLSQFGGSSGLAQALHLVRDEVLKGKVPLVFFDEFDSTMEGEDLFWLKYLLAPMQDGEFMDQGAVHPIGRSILVFAGGTAHSYAEFSKGRTTDDPGLKWFRAAKGPDFVSRLRGVLDLPGIDAGDGGLSCATLMRRAAVLRLQFSLKAPQLFDSAENLQIDPAVLRAFLGVRRYRHGIRSLEALLDMSQLAGRKRFDAGCLPHPQQMSLHVDATDFLCLLHSGVSLATVRETLAQALHKHYLQGEESKGDLNPAQPSHRPWRDLEEPYKDSNRQLADDIPRKLREVDRYMVKTSPDPVQNQPFNEKEVERIAEAEHDRWMREKYGAGWKYGKIRDDDKKLHPDLISWQKLVKVNPDSANKDREFAKFLPELLGRIGCEIRLFPTTPATDNDPSSRP